MNVNEDPTPVAPDSISAHLRSLALGVDALEARSNRQGHMLDKTMDLHNDLSDWACNTEHTEAADEVMRIVDKYFTRPTMYQQQIASVVIPMNLSRSN